MKKIHLKYFAVLRDAASKSEETLASSAQSLGELYAELQNRYQNFLPLDSVRVALNNQFCSMDSQFQENDRVVFIPPVAGG